MIMQTKFYLISVFILTLLFGCQSEQEDNNVSNNPKTEVEDSLEEASVSTTETQSPTFEAEYDEADYQEYYEGGQLKIEGNYNGNEQRHGRWVSYYDNGQKWSESSYKNGVKNGHSITFYPNGNVRYVGEYRNDDKSGTWTFYNEEGEVVKEETY